MKNYTIKKIQNGNEVWDFISGINKNEIVKRLVAMKKRENNFSCIKGVTKFEII